MCLTLGQTPEQVRQLRGEDYAMFRALYAVQPWGPERDNWHMAVLGTIGVNTHLQKGKRPLQPNEFMFGYQKQKNDKRRVSAFRAHIRESVASQQKVNHG